MLKILFLILIFFNLSSKTIANEISGLAFISDGDTIKILDNRIRLHGIDAPEKKQKCTKKKIKKMIYRRSYWVFDKIWLCT